MNPFAQLLDYVRDAVADAVAAGELPDGLDLERVTVEPPRDPSHGEAATNAALVLAKQARRKPLDIAALLTGRLEQNEIIGSVETVPPGFINLTLQPEFWWRRVHEAIRAGPDYGQSEIGRGQAVNVEFCSANPTGPLHIGHARGTVFGDALANVLAKAGFAVTREYYINDAGQQIEVLARSLHLRYREALGETIGAIPEGLYPGEYLKGAGSELAQREGEKWLSAEEVEWLPAFERFGVDLMMARIRDDLASLGVAFDRFSSEKALRDEGKIEQALHDLDELGLIYTGELPPPKGKMLEDWEPTPLLLFRSSAFGDDSDRPLKRSNGMWTYFAADVAYHLDKYRRGAAWMIDVLGADHGGYLKRMQAAVRAFSQDRARFDAKICQLVNFMVGGTALKMSKRAGRIVNLRDVVDEVGRDVVRFIMLTRKNDAPLEFDFEKVTERSRDNPVFYVQYAHARICSVFRNAVDMFGKPERDELIEADLGLLADEGEQAMIRKLAEYPRTVELAAVHAEPHRIAFYLYDLASALHAQHTRGREQPELRFLIADNESLTMARLAMLEAVRVVLAGGLDLMGVAAVDELS